MKVKKICGLLGAEHGTLVTDKKHPVIREIEIPDHQRD